MEITLDIDDDIFNELRSVSEGENRTLAKTVDEALRLGLEIDNRSENRELPHKG